MSVKLAAGSGIAPPDPTSFTCWPITRLDLGREKFVERVWKWKEEYGGTIIKQLKRLGVACDWRREAGSKRAR